MNRSLWIALALGAACAVALALAPFASSSPDGLETVAEGAGFADRFEAPPTVAAPLPDYSVPGMGSERTSTVLAGILGAAATAGALTLLGWGLSRRPGRGAAEGPRERSA